MRLKNRRDCPKALTPDETAALFIAKGDNTVLTLRDTAMFELLYSSALRVSEMVALDVADLDSSHRLVYVRQGKGGQGRVAPIGRAARQALKKWLATRAVAGCSHDALFIGKNNRRLGVRSVQLRLGRLAKKSAWPVASARMCFAILVLHISYNPAEICAQRKNCSAIKVSPPPKFIRDWIFKILLKLMIKRIRKRGAALSLQNKASRLLLEIA